MRKLFILYLLCNSACATTNQAALHEVSCRNFSVIIPERWEKFNVKKYLLITKYGQFYYDLVHNYTIDSKFYHTNKEFRREHVAT